MKRKRKKRTRLSVSLFPFLAVLICTLGVLIVMLVMAAKSADMQSEKAQAEDDQRYESKIAEIQGELDLRKIQIEGMESARPATLSRLAASRSNRSHVENDIRNLKQDFARSGEELRELHRQPAPDEMPIDAFSSEVATNELHRIRLNIEAAQADLIHKRELVLESGPVEYKIVPYMGSGGTFRRPIFIECTKDAITLQPSGIRLGKHEFVPPLEPGNMLDSALLAVREYWQQYGLDGEEGKAYPLIVVRPGGAETFVLARQAMKSWDDEFGYELIESGKDLIFGKRDLQLEAIVRSAIEEARNRQRRRMVQNVARNRLAQARMSASGSPDALPGLIASGQYGGFVSTGGKQMVDGQGSGTFEMESGRPEAPAATDSNLETSEFGMDAETVKNDAGSPSNQFSMTGQPSGNLAAGNPSGEQSIAQSRGRNWALPTQTAGGTPYLRPIRIHCGAGFLDVRDHRGASVRIPIPGATVDAVDLLVEEVWKQIDAWGISGASSYWKPELRFTIVQGGGDRFQELKRLLFQSGLVVKETTQ